MWEYKIQWSFGNILESMINLRDYLISSNPYNRLSQNA
jgi:hypothetical protein